MLDLSLVNAFVVVAELEHVGRAARVLGISQSPLSRKLQQLEGELGVPLFRREGRGLKLTRVGSEWLGEAKSLLSASRRAAERARSLAEGRVASINVGFVQSALWSQQVPAALRKLRKLHPDVKINVHGMRSLEQVAALERGALDLGVLYRPPGSPRFHVTLLVKEPFVLVLDKDHELLARKRILPRDLDGRDFVALARTVAPEHRERLLAACAKVGVSPRIVAEAHDFTSVIGLVAAGVGVALLQDGARRSRAGIVVRELSWLPLTLSTCVVHPAEPTALVAELARLLGT